MIEQGAPVVGLDLRGGRHLPATRVGECAAFYGIFGRHQHRRRITELEIDGAKGVMIGRQFLYGLAAIGALAVGVGTIIGWLWLWHGFFRERTGVILLRILLYPTNPTIVLPPPPVILPQLPPTLKSFIPIPPFVR